MTAPAATPGGQWEAIVREHGEALYWHAYRLTGNHHDAEDLAQETLVRVGQALDRRAPGPSGPWVRRIATNLFLDQVRRRARLRFEALAEPDDQLADPASDPQECYERNHLDGPVAGALAGLPDEFRAPVVLCCVDGHSYEEAARALDLKLGTVRSRIHRGRAALREALTVSA
jgi:RNA polymerase sigma-70 factor (ECF subfamily)